VSSHGAETGGTTEGESSKSSHVEVGVVHGGKVRFKRAVDLVTAQRSSNQSLSVIISLSLQCLLHKVGQLGVGKSTGERLLNLIKGLELRGFCFSGCFCYFGAINTQVVKVGDEILLFLKLLQHTGLPCSSEHLSGVLLLHQVRELWD